MSTPASERATSVPYPVLKRISSAALRAGRAAAPIHALVEVDVTDARSRLAAAPEDGSFTAFVIASVARAVRRHPEVHAYVDWRGRIVTSEHVDVATIVETPTSTGSFPLALLVRGADVRSVADITGDLRRTQADPGRSVRLAERLPAWAGSIPGVGLTASLVFRLLARTPRGRRRIGTVAVTAVGMFGSGGGYGIPAPTMHTATVVVGGIGEELRPRPDHPTAATLAGTGPAAAGPAAAGPAQRSMLHLTISCDHRLVDGGPMARFVADLTALIESGAALDATPDARP